jgi:hypothetical protein
MVVTGGQREQPVVNGLVNIDDLHAGFDGDLGSLIVEFDYSVHGTHVEQSLAVVERQVAVAPPGPARADGHTVLPAEGQRLAALFNRCWACDQGAGSNGADQGIEILPLHEARGCLYVRWHDYFRYHSCCSAAFTTGVEIQDTGRIVKETPEVVSKPHLTPKYGVAQHSWITHLF